MFDIIPMRPSQYCWTHERWSSSITCNLSPTSKGAVESFRTGSHQHDSVQLLQSVSHHSAKVKTIFHLRFKAFDTKPAHIFALGARENSLAIVTETSLVSRWTDSQRSTHRIFTTICRCCLYHCTKIYIISLETWQCARESLCEQSHELSWERTVIS